MAKRPRVYDGSSWQDLAVNQPDLSNYPTYTGIQHGFRNKLINGDFRINQRGYASGSTLSTSDGVTPVGYGYSFDRWKATTSGTFLNFVSSPNGQPITISANGSIAQIIERQNITNGTYTLSWQGTATGRVYNVGASAPAYAASPITVSLDGTANVIVEFTAVTSPQTLNLVQLEQGAKQTAFEYRPIQVELAQCQRYTLFLNGGGIAPGACRNTTMAYCQVSFPVEMRVAPNATIIGSLALVMHSDAGYTITSIATTLPTTRTVRLDTSIGTANLTAGYAVFIQGSSTAGILFSAEL